MAGELPVGTAIEPVYLVEARYGPDAEQKRPRYRAEHLERIVSLRNAGTIIEAGGCLDFSDSYLLVRGASADEVRRLVMDDVYMRSGVWVDARVREFGRVCRPDEVAEGA